MSSSNTDLLRWSASLKIWQQDALRRLSQCKTLSDEDVDESLKILCSEFGIHCDHPDVEPQPLSQDHLSNYTAHPHIRLKKIDNVFGVNRITENASLTFCPKSLTIVYGENGSGKSGFSRVIRAACRSRVSVISGRTPPILSDIHKNPSNTVASADILIEVDGIEKTISWKDQAATVDELRHVAVFESSAASLYVDDSAHISYLPFNIDLFFRLNSLCDSLRDRLQSRILAKSNCLSGLEGKFDDNSYAPSFLSLLSAQTNDGQIDAATRWLDEHNQRLFVVQSLLNKAAPDVADLQSLAKWVEGVSLRIRTLDAIVSEAAIQNYIDNKKACTEKRYTATALADGTFAKDPLPGVGQSTWLALYEAARLYSTTVAYQETPFPFTEDGSCCVLCQQPLDAAASERLKRFESFVSGKLSTEADNAEGFIRQQEQALVQATLNPSVELKARVEQIAARNPTVAKQIESWIEAYTERQSSIVIAIKTGDWGEVSPPADLSVLDGLSVFLGEISRQAAELSTSSEAGVKATLEKEKHDLEARKVLNKCLGLIKQRVADLKEIDKLNKALKSTVTTGITRKSGEFGEKFLTPHVKKMLADEIDSLGLKHLKPKFERKAVKIGAQYKIDLGSEARCKTSEVLSEGEQRTLALAAFLAEVRSTSATSPIVIDDPVSSLDIARSSKVATRLALEARERQVIIFTHSLVFYNQLLCAAADNVIEPVCVSIFRTDDATGNIDPAGPPWDGTPVVKRIGTIKVSNQEVKKLYNTSPQDYRIKVKGIYGRLRDTWERLVEERLFRGVISRFSEPVGTLKLIEVEVTDALYQRIDAGMTKCSIFSHDNSAGIAVQTPSPDEIANDIQYLADTISLIESSAKEARARRKILPSC